MFIDELFIVVDVNSSRIPIGMLSVPSTQLLEALLIAPTIDSHFFSHTIFNLFSNHVPKKIIIRSDANKFN